MRLFQFDSERKLSSLKVNKSFFNPKIIKDIEKNLVNLQDNKLEVMCFNHQYIL